MWTIKEINKDMASLRISELQNHCNLQLYVKSLSEKKSNVHTKDESKLQWSGDRCILKLYICY